MASAAQAATVDIKPDRITIGNDLIRRDLVVKDGICRTVRFINVHGKVTLDVTDRGPHIRLISGKEVANSSLRIAGPITSTPPSGKGHDVGVTIPVACTQPAAVQAQIHLRVADGQHVIQKWCDVQSAEPVDMVQVEQLAGKFKTRLGGRGQPLFVDEQWFAGLEYPAGYNEASSGSLRLYHFPGRKTFTSKRAVWGANVEGDLADSFESYLNRVRRSPRSFLQYNTWYDLRSTELAAETMVQRFEEFRKAFLGPYGLRFDAFVADDGWQNPQSVWDVNRKILPHGYKPLADALAKSRSRVGLWMPLNGTKLDIGWGVKQGYERASNGDYYCLASRRYGAAIRKAIETRIRDANLSYFKHDYNWFRCHAEGHLHLPTARHGFEANVDAFIDLLAYERRLQPDIFLNVTSGVWLSPWWLMHADAIWMAADDFGYDKTFPQFSPREWAMSYRDQHLFKKYRREGVQCPLSALMTHGIIHGRRNRLGGPNETLREWSDYVMLYYGRGVMLKELYITPSLLPAEWWDVLGRATQWALHNASAMVHTRMVGAEPRSGGVYGYVHWSDQKGIVVLRNPAPAAQTYELTTAQRPRRLGTPGPAWDVVAIYPYRELLTAPLAAKGSVTLQVPGCSVMVWELLPPGASGALPRGVRVLEGGRTCRAADVTAAVKVAPGSIGPTTKPASTMPASGPSRMTLRFSLPERRLPRADVLIVSRGANVMPIESVTVNGKPATMRKTRAAGWEMLRIDCSSLTGSVAIAAPVKQASAPFVLLPSTLEAWLLAELPLGVASSTSRPATTRASVGPSTTATTTRAVARSSPTATTHAAKPSPRPTEPLPRPYRPETLRQSYCLLKATSAGSPHGLGAALKPADLAKIKAAKLRIELFDVNGGAYADKHILLNGQPLCQIPPNKGDIATWQERIIDLPSDWLKRIKMTNTVQLTNKPHDLFKFRGIALAVQTADGRWVTSSLAGQTYATSANWRYAEGTILVGEVLPPISVAFRTAK